MFEFSLAFDFSLFDNNDNARVLWNQNYHRQLFPDVFLKIFGTAEYSSNHHRVCDLCWQCGGRNTVMLQCFYAVGWVTGRAFGLLKFCHNDSKENFLLGDSLTAVA